MKAIPTLYAGTQFRSRLEANFAAHFDGLGLRWEYEPEAFELDNGMKYLPDFYLPELNVWVEVKGGHLQRVDKFEAFSAQLWREAIDGDAEVKPSDPASPLCLLATVQTDGRPSFIASRGPGSAYSVLLSRHARCGKHTFSIFTGSSCRSCKTPDVEDQLFWTWGELNNTHPLWLKLTTAKVRQWMPTSR